MIGMMNNASTGGDGPAEFYAASCHRQVLVPSADGAGDGARLQAPHHRKKLSYTEEGRRLVDGQPETSETPEEMWKRAMLRACAERAAKEMLGEKRRKSSKLRRLAKLAQQGSFRHLFGSNKHRQQNQQQQNEGKKEEEKEEKGPGKPDRP